MSAYKIKLYKVQCIPTSYNTYKELHMSLQLDPKKDLLAMQIVFAACRDHCCTAQSQAAVLTEMECNQAERAFAHMHLLPQCN